MELGCSVCFTKDMPLTIIQGTIICKPCLEKAVETHKKKGEDQFDNIVADIRKINKDRDIYD